MRTSRRDREAVCNRQREVRLALGALQRYFRELRDSLGLKDAEVTVCLVSDKEMARMNKTFRRQNGPTDVLSFRAKPERRPARLKAGRFSLRKNEALGDIAISPRTAKRHAGENGRSVAGELHVLMLHGLLHLLGYDHETDDGQMSRLEEKLRRRFGLV